MIVGRDGAAVPADLDETREGRSHGAILAGMGDAETRIRFPGQMATGGYLHEQGHDLIDGAVDGRRQRRADSEVATLDGVDDETRRQASEHPRETDRFTHAERVSRHAAPRPKALDVGCLEGVDAARGAGSLAGVDDDDLFGALPGREERGGVTPAFPDVEAAGSAQAQAPRDRTTGGIIAAVRITDPDDADHASTISILRKWAEQEMQGS
jgi:hypothetical protein